MSNRRKAFDRLPGDEHVVVRMDGEPDKALSKVECALLLDKEAMSDEEDNELVRGSVARTFHLEIKCGKSINSESNYYNI